MGFIFRVRKSMHVIINFDNNVFQFLKKSVGKKQYATLNIVIIILLLFCTRGLTINASKKMRGRRKTNKEFVSLEGKKLKRLPH